MNIQNKRKIILLQNIQTVFSVSAGSFYGEGVTNNFNRRKERFFFFKTSKLYIQCRWVVLREGSNQEFQQKKRKIILLQRNKNKDLDEYGKTELLYPLVSRQQFYLLNLDYQAIFNLEVDEYNCSTTSLKFFIFL